MVKFLPKHVANTFKSVSLEKSREAGSELGTFRKGKTYVQTTNCRQFRQFTIGSTHERNENELRLMTLKL